jgi:hypothetical protein
VKAVIYELWFAISSGPALYKVAFFACLIIAVAALCTMLYVAWTGVFDVLTAKRAEARKRSARHARMRSTQEAVRVAAPSARPDTVASGHADYLPSGHQEHPTR